MIRNIICQKEDRDGVADFIFGYTNVESSIIRNLYEQANELLYNTLVRTAQLSGRQ